MNTEIRRRFRTRKVVGPAAGVLPLIAFVTACGSPPGEAETAAGTDTGAETVTTDPETVTETETAPGTTSFAEITPCSTDNLDLTFGEAQGVAGGRVVEVNFSNASDEDCRISGYPGIALVDADGAVIGASAEHDPALPDDTIRIAPGSTARAAVMISRAELHDEQECLPAPATGLQIIVPDDTATTVLEFGGDEGLSGVTGCADESVTVLSTQPIQS